MHTTEITLLTGERYEIQGSPEEVESTIIAASRGSIMQLAWLTERASSASVGINPACIVSLRAVAPDPASAPADAAGFEGSLDQASAPADAAGFEGSLEQASAPADAAGFEGS